MNATQIRKLEEKIMQLVDPLVEVGYLVMNQKSLYGAYDPEKILPGTAATLMSGPYYSGKELCGCLLGMASFAVHGYKKPTSDLNYFNGGATALDLSVPDAEALEKGFECRARPTSPGDAPLYDLGRRMAERYGLL